MSTQVIPIRAKSMVNCLRLTFFGFADEENEVYDASKVYSAAKALMGYNDNRSYNSTPNYGDGEETDREYGISSRGVEFQIHDLNAAGQALIHGHRVTASGVILRSNSDIIPYVGCAVMTKASGGKVNLYKFFKAKFPPSATSVTQKTEGNVSFSNTTLSGNYVDLERLGADSAIIKSIDPTTVDGAAFIENWFTIPDYYGDDTVLNTSTLTVDGTAVNSGDSITSGDTVTFNGSGTGGTAPYTYSFYYRAVGSDEWTAKAEDSSTATATQAITVVAQTGYEFKIAVKDANGVTKTKYWSLTVNPGE